MIVTADIDTIWGQLLLNIEVPDSIHTCRTIIYTLTQYMVFRRYILSFVFPVRVTPPYSMAWESSTIVMVKSANGGRSVPTVLIFDHLPVVSDHMVTVRMIP